YVIYLVKIYILICFLPAIFVWFFFNNLSKVKHLLLRISLVPVVLIVVSFLSYFTVSEITEENQKYSKSTLIKTAEITALDNSLWTVRKEGSGYSLGDYDFSLTGLLRKFIPAVWVTLYRPYLWEADNPMMVLSSIESLGMLLLTVSLLFAHGLFRAVRYSFTKPFVVFCLLFTISFAFAVGVSSGNFGSLVRYKIPLMPFFISSLFIINYYAKSVKNLQLSK
ncbi:MAG: hypothetical protein ACR2MX_09975, partial [Cyclobacteriaceae bacterium]